MSLQGIVDLVLVGLLTALLIVAVRRVFTRRGRSGIGPAAVGSVYDMLNEDKRKAVELVIEERAEAVDPETADGNLPDLSGSPSEDRRLPSKRHRQVP
jgi:hypothetical protein